MVLLADTFLKYGLMERVMSVFPYAYIIILLWMIYYLDRFAIYCMNTAKETDHYLVMSLLLWGCVSLSIASLINITNTSLSLLIMSIVAGFILLYRTCYGIISGKTSPLVRLTCACVFSILIVIYAAFNLAQYEISMNPPSTSDPNALNDIILIETINKVHELTTLNQLNNMIQNNTINWLHVVEKILTVYGAAIILYMNGLAIKDNDTEKDIRRDEKVTLK
jgi:membrane protein